MKKAIGYIRVSTEHQALEGVSLEAQKAKIVAWCKANDYDLANVFMDAGISGKSMDKRTGLADALKAVKKDMVLVVYSLSRLARSTQDTLSIANGINKAGADLVSLTERIDTTGAMGKMMFTLMAAFNQLERDVTSERTKTALQHKKAKGEKYSTTPFGYEAIEGRLIEVKAEAQIVASIMQQRQSGSTLVEIATHLNANGIHGKKGGKWHASTVRYLINRQAA
jgi:site-specific DNA recombinase